MSRKISMSAVSLFMALLMNGKRFIVKYASDSDMKKAEKNYAKVKKIKNRKSMKCRVTRT